MSRILFAVICISFFGCSSQRAISELKIPQFSYLEPISYIYHIDKKGKETLNDSLSLVNRDVLDHIYSTFSNDRIIIESDSMHYKMLRSVELLIEDGIQGVPSEVMQLSPEVQPILDQSKYRYTLGTLSDGFVVNKKKYRREMALWTTLTVLSMGQVSYIPPKNGSHLYGVLIDNVTREVTTFRFDQKPYKNPMDEKVLSKQVNKLIKRISKSYL